MLKLEYTAKMKRDVKRMQKQGKDMKKLDAALRLLVSQAQMPPQYRDHPLKGELNGTRECHLEGDWLLVYQILEESLVLLALGTGSHAELFDL
jgi:mRNA interferase YafQ